ncbi:hypothetical protein ACFO4O_14620 [Glaciecola siphonariae]|uniref:Transposase n=1 Tax=Glaciecola siphonariae TaxID=521012 RepID=A0ABV9LYM1_9ALTE
MYRKRRTKGEWKAKLDAQETRGVTTLQYCAKYDIHLQTFYPRKSDIDKPWPKPTAKAWAKIRKPQPVTQHPSPQLSLQYQDIVISILQTPESRWLSQVIKELAS